jgi:hypothetical protein
MPAANKYRNGRRVNLYVENDMLNDFKDICWSERKTLTDKINELIIETVEKKAKGDHTPIKVSYARKENKSSTAATTATTTTTIHLNLGFWLEHVKNVDNQKELDEIVAFTNVINRRASKRSMELYWKGIKK